MDGMDRARKLGLGVLVAGVVALGGCDRQDADRLADMGHKAAGHLEHVSGGAGGKLATALRGLLPGNCDTLEGRITARLHWDKSLDGAQIQVLVKGEAVELRGTVASQEQKQRAVQLAETTAGVERVSDLLTVP
jgi:hypothetical protein